MHIKYKTEIHIFMPEKYNKVLNKTFKYKMYLDNILWGKNMSLRRKKGTLK